VVSSVSDGGHDKPLVNDVTRLARICRLPGSKATPESGCDATGEYRCYPESPAGTLDSGSWVTRPQGFHSLSTIGAQSRLVVHMMWRLSRSARLYGVARESHTDL
jgi:hypothetical protein